ncbi:hypothetical protein AKJ56_00955 [candidate division MSBL1 archaeon SCGC-AAA382N08]|uniref:Uncharacterized protein n=1 Tax=candidate division MSBL1 archaeon SCGC-AAA382N08 TaxID=1698285 RepID=A0A133VQ42_9EURY|nr:hypothetical protein AKJ56_00955 [candidate division MSBL1 archaeon SCGC-AAA382N08]
MDKKTKQDHLQFKHQGKEEQYRKKCILCDRKLKGAGVKNEKGDLGVVVTDKSKAKDKFGG